jgi:hypothetical protein
MHGKVSLDHFEGDAWANPQAQALLKVMQTGPHPMMTDKPWCAEVIVDTHDGQRLSAKTEYLMGRGRLNPMSEAEMWVKFADCVARVLPADQITRLFDTLSQFERLGSIRDLTMQCEPRGLPANQAQAAD